MTETSQSTDTSVDRATRLQVGGALALLLSFASLVFVGSLGTWLTLRTLSPIGSVRYHESGTALLGEGWTTLILAVAIVLAVVASIQLRSKVVYASATSLFGSILVLTVVAVDEIPNSYPRVFATSVGWGLWLCIGSAAAGLATSLASFRLLTKSWSAPVPRFEDGPQGLIAEASHQDREMTDLESVTIDVQLTAEEVQMMLTASPSRRQTLRKATTAGYVLLALGVMDVFLFGWNAAPVIVLGVVAGPLMPVFRRGAMRRVSEQNQLFQRRRRYVFSPAGVDISDATSSSHLQWAAFEGVVEVGELSLLQRRGAQASTPIPRRSFSSMTEFERFNQIVSTGLQAQLETGAGGSVEASAP
jgi:hypothetical protein